MNKLKELLELTENNKDNIMVLTLSFIMLSSTGIAVLMFLKSMFIGLLELLK